MDIFCFGDINMFFKFVNIGLIFLQFDFLSRI